MRSLTLRTAAAAAVVPLALVSLAACGNGNDVASPDPHTTDQPTPSASQSAHGGSTHAVAKNVDPAAFVAKLKTAAGSITTARFTMTMDVSGQTVQAKGALDLTGSTPAMQMSMDLTGMGVPTEMRLVGGSMYIQDPSSGGSKYLKLDLNDPNGPLGDMGTTLGNLDPQAMIDKLSPDVYRKVTDLGSQTVHGQKTEHYRVLADVRAAGHELLQNLPSTVSLPKTMTYDVWLDGNGRMAQFKVLMKKVSAVTARYYDYGADLNITPPPASQVETTPSATG
jgi:hypothetical protein